MTKLNGTIKDSGNNGLTGFLKVLLDAPLSTGSKTLVLYARVFPVTNGDLTAANINLEPSTATNSTYRLTYYTVSDGVELPWLDFHCLMPSAETVNITDLLPTGIVRETIDTSLIRMVELLTTDAYYSSKLNVLKFVGLWRDDSLYYRGDVVEYDGSSYVYRVPTPSVGNLTSNSAFWQLLAGRGSTGTGNTGSLTNYGASWQDATDTPSRGAIFNLVESTLAKQSAIIGKAPINNPAFTGVPTVPTADALDATTQIANTAWVANFELAKSNPVLATSPPLGSSNKSVATTEWVQNTIVAAGGFSGGGGGGTIDLSGYAQLASPVFTGTPRAPLAPASEDSTIIASTAWVRDRLDALPSTTAVTVTTSGGITTFNYGGGVLCMMGLVSVNKASWNYQTWHNLVVNFPFALSQIYNIQATWAAGLADDTGYMKYRAYSTSETSLTISAMWSNSYYNVNGQFYWQVTGKQ